jgi:hypothetical protein
MRDKTKKILGLTLATLTVAASFAGCTVKYKGDAVDGYVSNAEVRSNGGFAVEKGEFIYFINAQETMSANNEYGKVVKGALMRISKADLEAGKNTAITIVPSLLVSQNMTSGIYIYDNYVYYATPTTDKNLSGEVEYSYVDFKCAPLDGSAAPSDYFVRTADNDANYRFVKVGEKVYCLYEESIENEKTHTTEKFLRSYNITDDKLTTLVKGDASQTFYFDTKNAENPNVYYTMPVTLYADSEYSTAADYNQVYCVNAAATVTVDTKEAKYSVYNGQTKIKEYDFDQNYMEEANKEAEKDHEPYNLKDYTTYPYVNLGSIVFDGIGINNVNENADSRFVWDTDTADRLESDGYTYTVKSYQGNALYFTRSAVATTSSPGTDTRLYYLADTKIEQGNSVGMNNFGVATNPVETVAKNTTNTETALFYTEGATQYYIYFGSGAAYKAGYDNETDTEIAPVCLFSTENGESTKLIALDETDKFFYYYSGSGNELSRINYSGSADDYNAMLGNNPDFVQYQPIKIPAVKCNTTWYNPEFFGSVVLYAGAQTYGSSSTSYYYIHTAKLGTAKALADRAKAYEDVKEAILDYSTDAKISAAIEYYFQTGETEAYDDAKKLYPKKYSEKQQAKIAEFIAKFAEGGEYEGCRETDFITFVGKMTEEDAEAIANSWTEYFAEATEATEDEGLPTWAIVLICVGGALIVAAGVTIPLVIVYRKKKAAALEAEATVNAYKRKKIDTTDDKSIDVYADEDTQTETEETTEEATETVSEEAVEEEQSEAVETQDNE